MKQASELSGIETHSLSVIRRVLCHCAGIFETCFQFLPRFHPGSPASRTTIGSATWSRSTAPRSSPSPRRRSPGWSTGKRYLQTVTWGQCYESFKGLYLQVCNCRAIFKMTCSQTYCHIRYAYAWQLKYFVSKRENKQEPLNLTILWLQATDTEDKNQTLNQLVDYLVRLHYLLGR